MKIFSVSLRVSDTQLVYNAEHQPTLLDFLQSQRIAIDYQCREGYCGACRTTLRSGSVTYAHSPLAFLQPGDILPCCCRPCGDIELEL
ncbi:MAG: CDP-6-deoxy-L-threo-D-glycero-4-hexulose-3-dehydrase reductase [Candidatus Erwinia impunctatus]|nr:CDP-6-deoxy-L-threo-D-glycero-4-hexulose-3-dehydrase reductase [Culicoides impunctatus]